MAPRRGSRRGLTGGKSMLTGRSKGYRIKSTTSRSRRPKRIKLKGF